MGRRGQQAQRMHPVPQLCSASSTARVPPAPHLMTTILEVFLAAAAAAARPGRPPAEVVRPEAAGAAAAAAGAAGAAALLGERPRAPMRPARRAMSCEGQGIGQGVGKQAGSLTVMLQPRSSQTPPHSKRHQPISSTSSPTSPPQQAAAAGAARAPWAAVLPPSWPPPASWRQRRQRAAWCPQCCLSAGWSAWRWCQRARARRAPQGPPAAATWLPAWAAGTPRSRRLHKLGREGVADFHTTHSALLMHRQGEGARCSVAGPTLPVLLQPCSGLPHPQCRPQSRTSHPRHRSTHGPAKREGRGAVSRQGDRSAAGALLLRSRGYKVARTSADKPAMPWSQTTSPPLIYHPAHPPSSSCPWPSPSSAAPPGAWPPWPAAAPAATGCAPAPPHTRPGPGAMERSGGWSEARVGQATRKQAGGTSCPRRQYVVGLGSPSNRLPITAHSHNLKGIQVGAPHVLLGGAPQPLHRLLPVVSLLRLARRGSTIHC